MSQNSFHEIMMHLGYVYLELFRKEKFTLEMIFILPTVRQMLLSIYSSMVARKMIMAIEKLPADIKDNLKKECREYTAGRPTELSIEFAKCYWTMDQLAKMKEEK